jgi:hypothetical protein
MGVDRLEQARPVDRMCHKGKPTEKQYDGEYADDALQWFPLSNITRLPAPHEW